MRFHTHQDDTLATESLTDLVHLLRGDIVDRDDEDRLFGPKLAVEYGELFLLAYPVGLQKSLELVKVQSLSSVSFSLSNVKGSLDKV